MCVHGFLLYRHTERCLMGFTQTIPPMEEWDNYAAFDNDGGKFLYPELMFKCNGTLNSITVPFSTTQGSGIVWDNILSLDMAIWRRQSVGGYAHQGQISSCAERITRNHSTTECIKRTVTITSVFEIQENDIILVSVKDYSRHESRKNVREHIPFLLRPYQPPGCTKTVTIPMIAVNFTPKSSKGKPSS